MNNNNLHSLFSGINFETALLEACHWNEAECKKVMNKLSEYFSLCSKQDLDIIKCDLDLAFSNDVSELVIDYLKLIKNKKGR
jgi:hypothetical protein